MRFLIKGAECSKNKGTAAILKSSVLTLRKFFDKCVFISASPHPELDKRNCSSIHFLDGLWSKSRIFTIIKNKDHFDCVIDLSGDTISDDYGKLTSFGLLYDILIYKCLKKPYIIYAQSLGPFTNILTRIVAKLSFKLTDLIIVREKITGSYLEDLGINDYCMGADPAFLLPSKERNLKNMIGKDFSSEKPIIGINMSQHIYDLLGNKATKYIDIHVQLIEFLIKNFNVNVLLIPHVLSEGFDDLTIAKKVYSKIKNRDSLYIIEGNYTPEEIKSVIGKCDLFIGARMHATIASTSMFVPTVGIAYSHKMHGIIGEMLGLKDYIIDIKDLSSEILIEKTLKAWDNREEIQEHLKKVIPKVKKRAWKNGELVKELCESLGIS